MLKNISFILMFVISVMVFTSCVEEGPERLPLPPVLKNVQIEDIIGQKYINYLKSREFPIYEGTTPPNITGCYLANAKVLMESNYIYDADELYMPGIWSPEITRFFDYKPADRRLNSESRETTTTSQSFGNISGTGSNFTYFAITTSVTEIKDKSSEYYGRKVYTRTAEILSGTLTSAGIQEWCKALIVLDKTGDTPNDNITVPIDVIRVYIELDGWNPYTLTYTESLAANWNWDNIPWKKSMPAASSNNTLNSMTNFSFIDKGNTTISNTILHKIEGGK